MFPSIRMSVLRSIPLQSLCLDFLRFVKIPIYLGLFLCSALLCCCRVLNSCLKVGWRLCLGLDPCNHWEQVLDCGTAGVLNHPKQCSLSRRVQLGPLNLYSSTRFLCFGPLSLLGPGMAASDSLKRLECSYKRPKVETGRKCKESVKESVLYWEVGARLTAVKESNLASRAFFWKPAWTKTSRVTDVKCQCLPTQRENTERWTTVVSKFCVRVSLYIC